MTPLHHCWRLRLPTRNRRAALACRHWPKSTAPRAMASRTAAATSSTAKACSPSTQGGTGGL